MCGEIVFKPYTKEQMEKLNGKFYFNEDRKTLHQIGNCHHTKVLFTHQKIYLSEEDAIASEKQYMAYCKKCFKNKY